MFHLNSQSTLYRIKFYISDKIFKMCDDIIVLKFKRIFPVIMNLHSPRYSTIIDLSWGILYVGKTLGFIWCLKILDENNHYKRILF